MKLKLDSGKVLTVKLVKDGNDNIDVVITKADGQPVDSGILLTLKSCGRFTRIGRINNSLGLDLGDGDRIKEQK